MPESLTCVEKWTDKQLDLLPDRYIETTNLLQYRQHAVLTLSIKVPGEEKGGEYGNGVQDLKIVWDASRPSLSLQLRLGGLGERSRSPSGSGLSPVAKRILTHFRLKFVPFWVSNAALFF